MPDPTPMPERPDRRAWGKFALWALAYPLLVGLFDVWLFRSGGYRATITGCTRAIFHYYPVVALPVGLVFWGLYLHFFHTFSFAASNRPALLWFWTAAPIVAWIMYRPLYG